MPDQLLAPADRRRRYRFPCTGRGNVQCRPGSAGPDLAVCALDVSEGGVRLILQSVLAVGSEVEVALSADAFPGAVHRTARVVWCFPLATGGAWVGVSFDRPLPFAILQALYCAAGDP